MNNLIITGHPKKESHTNQIAQTYRDGVERLGHETKTIDVYSTEFSLPFMTFEKDSLIVSGTRIFVSVKNQRYDYNFMSRY